MNNSQKQGSVVVIKVGGSFFTQLAQDEAHHDVYKDVRTDAQNTTGASALLSTIAELQANKQAVVVVHGGGEQVLKRLDELQMKSVRKDGLRVTPDSHMPIVTSVLAGELNKQLVATAAKYNINAVGISLADGNIAICEEHPADLGAVGMPKAENSALFDALFSANIVPIVASIGRDKSGRLYNVNADHAAICIAELLNTELYFFADVKGVLDANMQLINELCAEQIDQLIKNDVIKDGMAVKVKAAQYAANNIQQAVTIASWDNAREILIEHGAYGTQILPELR